LLERESYNSHSYATLPAIARIIILCLPFCANVTTRGGNQDKEAKPKIEGHVDLTDALDQPNRNAGRSATY
jgi:hypothetical protein